MPNHIVCTNKNHCRYKNEHVVLISYADNLFKPSQKLQTKSALKHCHFDEVIEYSREDIDINFYFKNKKILDIKRGGGLWLWKPYFILRTLESLNEGDILVYIDSGAMFIKDINEMIDIMKITDIWTTDIPLIEKQWTKRVCFERMDCLDEKFLNSRQVAGGFLSIRKNKYTLNIMKEWLSIDSDFEMISPLYCTQREAINEIPDFIRHTEDESILSLLIKKYKLPIFSDPTQFVYYPESYLVSCEGKYLQYDLRSKIDYSPFLLLHRSRGKVNYFKVLAYYAMLIFPKSIISKLLKIYIKHRCVHSAIQNFNKSYCNLKEMQNKVL